MKTIESVGVAKENVIVRTFSDPTGTPPDFAVTSGATEPSSWVAGEWNGSFDVATSEIPALTPTMGSAGALVVAGGSEYDLWVRWTIGVETPVELVGRIRVT